MCIKETCFNAYIFPVNKDRVITIFNKSMSPWTQQILYTVYLYGILTQHMQVGSSVQEGGTYFKIENGDDPIS